MSTAATEPVSRYVEHVMGMPISLALRGRHTGDAPARRAWRAVVEDLRRADAVFSTWREDSVVSRIRRGDLAPDDAPPEVHEVLRIGAAATRATDGAFSVYPHGRLDPSAVVKGWAVERACRHLRDLDDTGFCLSAGGDMQARALDPDRPWVVGIEDPRDTTRLLAGVPVVDGAVATSGTAHRGTHLVDARTGQAPDGIAQVTVIAPSLTDADVDATAAYALGAGAADWLRRRVGRTALVVHPDGRAETVVSHRASARPGRDQP